MKKSSKPEYIKEEKKKISNKEIENILKKNETVSEETDKIFERAFLIQKIQNPKYGFISAVLFDNKSKKLFFAFSASKKDSIYECKYIESKREYDLELVKDIPQGINKFDFIFSLKESKKEDQILVLYSHKIFLFDFLKSQIISIFANIPITITNGLELCNEKIVVAGYNNIYLFSENEEMNFQSKQLNRDVTFLMELDNSFVSVTKERSFFWDKETFNLKRELGYHNISAGYYLKEKEKLILISSYITIINTNTLQVEKKIEEKEIKRKEVIYFFPDSKGNFIVKAKNNWSLKIFDKNWKYKGFTADNFLGDKGAQLNDGKFASNDRDGNILIYQL